MAKVEIYTSDWCGYCARAKRLLASKGVAFQEISAEPGTAGREEARKRAGGRTSVPQIFIDGRHIGGSDELAALNQSGQLDALLAR